MVLNLLFVGNMLWRIISSNITLKNFINDFKVELKIRFPKLFAGLKAVKDTMGAFRNWRKLRKIYNKWVIKKKKNKDLPFFNDDNMVKDLVGARRN